jgi:hypothetical protein
MTWHVECCAGAKADKRPVRFPLGDLDIPSKKYLNSGTLQTIPFSKRAEWTLESFQRFND